MPDLTRAIAALSGGVDSALAAALLLEDGFAVEGVHLARESGAPAASDAARVAAHLGIPFRVLDAAEDFGELARWFCDEYASGRTPSPCHRCNRIIKFKRLLALADDIGAGVVATGHYARLVRGNAGIRLFAAREERKDQSDFLSHLPPDALARALFPLGEFTKDHVRAEARRRGLPVADRPESQEICFIPNGDYAEFVGRVRPDAAREGPILDDAGKRLGTHGGIHRYTIGQRQGLGIAAGRPLCVIEIRPEENVLVVGPSDAAFRTTFTAAAMNWLAERPPTTRFRASVKIRHRHTAAPAFVTPLADGRIRVIFDGPQHAITPGQASVVYDGEEVVGGGWIESVER
ncbi:MAG: tRNA 2-thiouridine(34) synthase MnmA [Planctomycetota bacterium]